MRRSSNAGGRIDVEAHVDANTKIIKPYNMIDGKNDMRNRRKLTNPTCEKHPKRQDDHVPSCSSLVPHVVQNGRHVGVTVLKAQIVILFAIHVVSRGDRRVVTSRVVDAQANKPRRSTLNLTGGQLMNTAEHFNANLPKAKSSMEM